jgi:hypothetical protein
MIAPMQVLFYNAKPAKLATTHPSAVRALAESNDLFAVKYNCETSWNDQAFM